METLDDRFLDLLGLALSVDDKSDFYWNFYVIGIFAVIGWVFSRREERGIWEKTGLTVGFLLFAAVNLFVQLDLLSVLNGFTEELRAIARRITFHSELFRSRMEFQDEHDWVLITWLIHGAADPAVVALIWCSRGPKKAP